MTKKHIMYYIIGVLILFSTTLKAEHYILDTKGAHAFVQFRIKHLGYSWLYGRFNTFEGSFDIDRDNLKNLQYQLI